MRARLVRMGNSRGVRLPKPWIEALGLRDEVELRVQDGVIEIAPLRRPREGWAEAAARVPVAMLDPEVPTPFDESEWQW